MLNDDLREENLKLRAENKRLRAALEVVLDTPNLAVPDDATMDGCTYRFLRCIEAAAVALACLLPGTHHDAAGGKS